MHEEIMRIYISIRYYIYTRFRDSKAKEIQSPNFCKPGGNHFRASNTNNYGITWWENVAHYLDVLLGILAAWCIAPLCYIHAHMYIYMYKWEVTKVVELPALQCGKGYVFHIHDDVKTNWLSQTQRLIDPNSSQKTCTVGLTHLRHHRNTPWVQWRLTNAMYTL